MSSRTTVRLVVPLLLLVGLLAPAPAPGHGVPTSSCDPQSDTFLFCESARLRDSVCVCGTRNVAGCKRPVKKLMGTVNEAMAGALRAQEAGDGAGVEAGVSAAESALDKTSGRLARILGKRKKTQACGASAGAAVDAFTLMMDERLGAFGSSTTTTTTLPDGGTVTTTTVGGGGGGTTTTTTLPPAVSCFGTLTIYPSDASQVFFQAWCDHDVAQFAIVVPGMRSVTGGVPPVGFDCSSPMSDRYVCTGPLVADVWINGRMTLDPAPSVGMGSDLYAWYGGVAVGPFSMTGP